MTASARILSAAFGLGLALAALVPAAPARAQAAAPAPQRVLLRVSVDAAGKVGSATPLDASNAPALIQAGEEIARKLTFTPATKDGRAVASETSLMLTLAFVPRAAGGYGISLARAQNGPSITALGDAGGTFGDVRAGRVAVSVDLGPEGLLDMKSFAGAPGADAKLVEIARKSLAGTSFLLDKVDGFAIPARLTFDFDFAANVPPSVSSVSKIEGITFPRIDYKK